MGLHEYGALAALMESLQTPSQPSSAPTFFTLETLFSAAGATTAVITVTAILHGIFKNLPAKWFALGFALLLTLAGIGFRNEGWTLANIFLAVINGLVVYSAAVGVNSITTAPASGATPRFSILKTSYRWWS